MGRRKKSINTPYPVSSSITSPKTNQNNLSVDNVPISQLWSFYDIMKSSGQEAFFNSVALQIASAMVVVVMLVQLRISLRNVSDSKDVDALPSFKFYKSRIISGPPGIYTGILVGISYSVHFEQCEDFEVLIGWYFDSFTRFFRSIDKCTSSNYVQFVKGKISRVIGLLSACPSTNIKLIGLGNLKVEEIIKLTVEDVLNMIGLNKDNSLGITSELVIDNIRTLILQTSSGIEKENIQFNEVESQSSIETAIFSNGEIIRSGNSDVLPSELSKQTIPDDVMQDYLTPRQYHAYKIAVSMKQNEFVRNYIEIVVKAQKEQAKLAETPISTGGADPPPEPPTAGSAAGRKARR